MPPPDTGTASLMPERLRPRVEALVVRLPEQVTALDAEARAGVLLLLTHTLHLVARTWAPELLDNPGAAPRRALLAALSASAEANDFLTEFVRWNGMSKANLRQLLSTEVALLTLCSPLSRAAARATYRVWRDLWLARPSLGRALIDLREWERATGIEGLPRGPDGEPPDDAAALAVATQLPAFLRRPPPPSMER